MIFALIKNSVVENTILCGSKKLATEMNPGYEVVNIDGNDATIGWKYDGKEFSAPVVVKTPEEISASNMAIAQVEYEYISIKITALSEQIQDADWEGSTEVDIKEELSESIEYRKSLRAYLKAADGNSALPVAPKYK